VSLLYAPYAFNAILRLLSLTHTHLHMLPRLPLFFLRHHSAALQMTLSELRVQLDSRGLDLSGSKAALEMRLAHALVIEIVGPEAAGVMGNIGSQAAAGAEEVSSDCCTLMSGWVVNLLA
jgi:hypothetical protein